VWNAAPLLILITMFVSQASIPVSRAAAAVCDTGAELPSPSSLSDGSLFNVIAKRCIFQDSRMEADVSIARKRCN
jgi:hypothetical protein